MRLPLSRFSYHSAEQLAGVFFYKQKNPEKT
jgi:hypothetical protein